jgi:hypothetical protein
MKARIAILVTCLALALALPVLAQVSANYPGERDASSDLSWHVIAGGGGRMESVGHTMLGTAGQPLVGTMMTSSGHTLCSGFWCSGGGQYRVYLPLVVRDLRPTSGIIFSDDFEVP